MRVEWDEGGRQHVRDGRRPHSLHSREMSRLSLSSSHHVDCLNPVWESADCAVSSETLSASVSWLVSLATALLICRPYYGRNFYNIFAPAPLQRRQLLLPLGLQLHPLVIRRLARSRRRPWRSALWG